MNIGIAFPSMESHDPEAMKEFIQGAEQLGFQHTTVLEHTLGVRSEFPQQCNPNLQVCAIKDFLKSSNLAEHISCSGRPGETPFQTRKRLLRQSMLYLRFSAHL